MTEFSNGERDEIVYMHTLLGFSFSYVLGVRFLSKVFSNCHAVVGQYLGWVWCLVTDSGKASPLPSVIRWCGTANANIKCHLLLL